MTDIIYTSGLFPASSQRDDLNPPPVAHTCKQSHNYDFFKKTQHVQSRLTENVDIRKVGKNVEKTMEKTVEKRVEKRWKNGGKKVEKRWNNSWNNCGTFRGTIRRNRMSKQLREVCSGDVIFLLFVKAPKCQPPGPLGSVVLGQNMDISGRLDGTGCSA